MSRKEMAVLVSGVFASYFSHLLRSCFLLALLFVQGGKYLIML